MAATCRGISNRQWTVVIMVIEFVERIFHCEGDLNELYIKKLQMNGQSTIQETQA